MSPQGIDPKSSATESHDTIETSQDSWLQQSVSVIGKVVYSIRIAGIHQVCHCSRRNSLALEFAFVLMLSTTCPCILYSVYLQMIISSACTLGIASYARSSCRRASMPRRIAVTHYLGPALIEVLPHSHHAFIRSFVGGLV